MCLRTGVEFEDFAFWLNECADKDDIRNFLENLYDPSPAVMCSPRAPDSGVQGVYCCITGSLGAWRVLSRVLS